MTLDASLRRQLRWSSRESRCSRLSTSTELWTIPVVRENGNFYCHERLVCSWSPWRQNWAGSMDEQQQWFRSRSWYWNHWIWFMKHAPNGREESKTARDWDPRTHETRAWPTAGKHKEFTKQPSVLGQNIQEKDRLYVNIGEQKILKYAVRVICRTQQKAPGPSEAQRNTMIEEKSIMRSALKHTKRATLHTQRKKRRLMTWCQRLSHTRSMWRTV